MPTMILPDDEVHVWRARLELPAARQVELESVLSSDERERAGRLRIERDRLHFAAARGILRSLLGEYLRVPAAEIAFRTNQHGKPAVAKPRAALRFNLSHSGGVGLFAFAWRRELGVDLEAVRADLRALEIARRFFSPREAAVLAALPDEERLAAFFDCWTRKEAFVKAKGRGLSFPLRRFDVAFAPREPPGILRVAWDREAPRRWKLVPLDAGPGYAAALVAERQDWTLVMRDT